jgi:hypothetical protein
MSPKDQNLLLDAMRALTLSPETSPNVAEDADVSSEGMSTADLEAMFLAPEPRYSQDWLNKLQQCPY